MVAIILRSWLGECVLVDNASREDVEMKLPFYIEKMSKKLGKKISRADVYCIKVIDYVELVA